MNLNITDLPLKIALQSDKIVKIYIDYLHQQLVALTEDNLAARKFFQAERRLLNLELEVAKTKKSIFQIEKANKKLIALNNLNIYFLKMNVENLEIASRIKVVEPEDSIRTKEELETVSVLDKPEETESRIPLPDNFSQFTYSASVTREHLYNDFLLLNNTINPVTHKPFMEIGKIKALLKKNFQVFKSKPNGNYFELSLDEDQKYIMRNFMYQIYKKYKRFGSNKKTDYASFLINNFELFLNAKPKTLSKNMRKGKAKKNLIIVPAWN